ncbi:unnamed protein product [Didymodactylos carnosus]|uniref:Serine hydrolase domain-containing protein n=1 Tax=Didymodactylos carnosus TaxID=1234261 RepID=A0A8S2MEY7_9BILA|nr:unnamed protein product [Didymodactylos carnosus]CAF3952785.1 unnamed protein product [Didymodactylos carnosus]
MTAIVAQPISSTLLVCRSPDLPLQNEDLSTSALAIDDQSIINTIYNYWFGDNVNTWSKSYPLLTKLWFKFQRDTDREIQEKFEKYLIEASNKDGDIYKRWQSTCRGKIVLILLFDQFSRNIYRGTPDMFKYDQLALDLTLEIVNEQHVTLYSLPERIFLYFPLIHSENLIYTTKGVQLMNDLPSSITQRDLRKRYLSIARATKTHQHIIELFGRYPHRNQLLGRQSTKDEEDYLKTARNEFIKSVQSMKPPSPLENTTTNNTSPTPALQTEQPLKILVLHSFRQNANSLRRTTKKLVKLLKGIATFYFANAPLPYNPTGEIKLELLSAFGDGNLPETSYQRQWWNASKDNRSYHHLDVSIHYIDQLFKSDGPFDGILGFSQGGALTGILCGLQPFSNISFRFAILISGFPSRADVHEQIMKPNYIQNFPSLHIYGTKDELVDNERTLRLASVFKDAIIVSHSGGHFTPNKWPSLDIKSFLIEQQKSLNANKQMIKASIDQQQLFATFHEKIEATIFNHQKQSSQISARNRMKSKESNLTHISPVGLSKQIDETTIDKLIKEIDDYLFDDILLLIWCKRTTFHNPEPKDDDLTFFRYWILLYLKKPDQMLTYLDTIPKYGSWADLKTLSVCANQMKTDTEKQLLENLQQACVKMFGEQLKRDYRLVLRQPDDYLNDKEEIQDIKPQEWLTNCAKEAPRIGNNRYNYSTDIAKYLHPISINVVDQKQLDAEKGYCYQYYKRLLTAVCQILQKASPSFVDEQMKARNRKDRALQYTKEQREQLLNAEPSSYVLQPEAEPVVPCPLEELEPLLEHMSLDKGGPIDDQSIVFPRGAIMTGGRLDLCKQVVGPEGIQPLLNAMKYSSVIHRLLLGNNIVGIVGARGIADYIRNNHDSKIDTWYIAGNNFDGDCMALICDALTSDTKVKALWLKRNPILAAGVGHISKMLELNKYLQTLDLLNTGLLDDGCEILFNGLKSNQTLKHLYIDTNGLTVKSGRVIRAHLELGYNHLETLYLCCNQMGDQGTIEIAAGLKHDKCLKRLGLASNCVGADGAKALADALSNHPSLEQLNLGYMKATILLGGLDNVIGDQGAVEIARLIRSNNHIRSIDLTFNGISQKGLSQVKDALKENKILTTFKLLQYGQVHNEITKEEIVSMLERNKMEWGKQILRDDPTKTEYDWIKLGEKLNEQINFPQHVMEIISYYRTH